ncbi:MAG: glycosyltransferase family 2 protein [Woeseia sp.]
MLQLSVVIPVFNERANLRPLIEEIERALSQRLPCEIIMVDDGSTDGTSDELTGLARVHQRLRVQCHESNRGQSAAIRTGVKAANAPVVAVLDGDGQNDPADIPALYAALIIGSNVSMVVGERRKRLDSWIRRVSSRIANAVRSGMLGDGIQDTGCGLKVFYRDEFLELPAFDHMHRFLPALVQRHGASIQALPVNHRQRRYGKSKYGISNRLWVGIVDLLGVMWLKRRRI